ncbi:DinB family protein [Ferruginibacter sp. HRS2-29]|uniref:DinB family protein n=1 Tax=Ferruginibacter sp. HRS2-29 TaxID=2487334 RepID=UPI0020CE6ED4|nr:DinB family protein [Ferruginibacter sp. HRS2-29]MCP9750331.1 DinB family protein [Ferruginibacter sp. HRS2-29]
MEIQPISSRMFTLLVLYDMQTDYFKRAIEGISHQDAQNRLETKANHVAWLAGSLVHERFELARQLGGFAGADKGNELFKDHKGIQDGVTYPSLTELQEDWETISPVLRQIYQTITDEKLDTGFEMMPGENMTYFELISFMNYREANCIGQIALWRRLLGYPAINYM